jgi:predicted SprT family Zn-dependent metalloprotease
VSGGKMRLQDVEVLRNTEFITPTYLQKLDDVSKEIQDSFQKYNLEGWNYQFNKTRRILGRCFYKKKIIEVSIYNIFSSRSDYKDTINHEIAHALASTYKDFGHGKIWKFYCGITGAIPRACKIGTDLSRYKATCSYCGTNYYKNKRPSKLKLYICSRGCQVPYNILVFKRNGST